MSYPIFRCAKNQTSHLAPQSRATTRFFAPFFLPFAPQSILSKNKTPFFSALVFYENHPQIP
ncbi:MAG: hypothetical protein K2N12_07195, partial [Helicobacter sp.]|nr:hypothetical protein [Helicobacter sp.]